MNQFQLQALLFVLLAPLAGGLLAGADRILTARLQSRVGPPLLQPFYDVLKLLGKRNLVVNAHQNFYVLCFLVFMVIAGAIFFAGGNLLLCVFALTLAAIFLVLAAYSVSSPYANIGAARELLQMMAYEPMLLLTVLGFYTVTGSFLVADIAAFSGPHLLYVLPATFLGYLFILTIKLRKSPFDLSTSHHGHQELVKGLTTEFAGPALAAVEVAHWYENVLLLGFVWLFFSGFAWWIAAPAVALAYLAEIFVDNTHARLTWQFTLRSAWVTALLFGGINLTTAFYHLFQG